MLWFFDNWNVVKDPHLILNSEGGPIIRQGRRLEEGVDRRPKGLVRLVGEYAFYTINWIWKFCCAHCSVVNLAVHFGIKCSD